jgi:hypothetical protein
MPIARRGDNGSRSGYATGARLVFDVKPATEFATKFLCNNARRNIGNPACGKRQDDTHGLARVFGFSIGLPLSKREGQDKKQRQGNPKRHLRNGAIRD